MTMGHEPNREGSAGRYVFGLLPTGEEITLDVDPFAGCCPIELVRVPGLRALTARVAEDQAAWVAIPEDPGELVRLVGDHDRIIRAAAATGRALVPLRFGTVVADLGDLRRRIDERCGDIVDALERLDGCDEWGVHVSVPRRAPQRAVRAIAAHVYDRLAVSADDAVIEPVEARAAEVRPSVLSAAFLVNRDRHRLFERTLQDLGKAWAGMGATVRTSGPWPAYHFARVDLGAPSCREARALLGPLGDPERSWTSTAPRSMAGGAVR
jgi:hypothetical protein